MLALVALVFLCRSVVAVEAVDLSGRLEYRIAWNGIPAANAEVEITPQKLAGDPAYAVRTTARTNRFVDLFWSFRGEARATFLARGLVPVQFTYDRSMRGVRYLTWIDFDLADHRARSVYIKGGKRKKEFDIDSSGLLDPITAVFQARLSSGQVGTRLHYDVFTGESHYQVALRVAGEDVVEVPAGRFAAIKVIPQVWKVRGPDRPRDKRFRQAAIWVTRDPAHVLLRIRSEVYIGAVTLDLVKAEPPA